MSRSHIAYGPKDNIQKVIEEKHIPKNCLVITKVSGEEEAEMFFYDKNYTPHAIATRHMFRSMDTAREWIEKYNCVGNHLIVQEEDEWHIYIVNDENELILSDGSDKISVIVTADAALSIGGTDSAPTISLNIDPEFANGLTLTDNGLAIDVATTESNGAMSVADKVKLSHIEDGAEVNRINKIGIGSQNGTISVDGVDVQVRGLGSAAFTNADDYAPMGTGMSYAVVAELPTRGRNGTIYLLPNTGEESNIFDEFLYIDGEFELIGTTKTDLSDYYTMEAADAKIEDVVTDAIADKVEDSELATVAKSGSYNDLSDKPTFPIMLTVTRSNDGYYYAPISYNDALSILEAGHMVSIHWPENGLMYQCSIWKSTSSAIYFGAQDGATYRVLRWDNRSGRIEAYDSTSFASATALNNKVDKVDGKGLSTNDFTDEYKAKLDAFGAASLYALKSDIEWIYKYKGSVPTSTDLPSIGNIVGDIYNVEDTDMNYAWNGVSWDPLGGVADVESINDTEIDNIIG